MSRSSVVLPGARGASSLCRAAEEGLVYFCWWFFKWEVVLGKKNSFCCHLTPDSVHASTVTSDYKPQVILREKLLEKKANVWE